VKTLLVEHYDPAYRRSSARNFSQLSHAEILGIDGLDFDRAARSLLKLLEVGEHPQVLYDASA
jgi:hypothetical protein